MKRGVPVIFFTLCCFGLALSHRELKESSGRSSFTTYELGQSPCFATEDYKKAYHKCEDISARANPYQNTQTCGYNTTIPKEKLSSCGLEDAQDALSIHNSLREKWGAAPLVWSRVLSNSAQAVADMCEMQPSGSEFGENMLLSSGTLTCSQSSTFWHESEELWQRLGAENPDYYPDTGTFTQMVWKNTMQVGCAKSQCNSGDLVVCHYYPPGNVVGGSNFAKNVGSLGEKPPCTVLNALADKLPKAEEVSNECCTKFLGFIKICDSCNTGNRGVFSSLLL